MPNWFRGYNRYSESAIIPVAGGLAVLVLALTRVIYFFLGPTEALIGVIPDDGFYYLQMARHRVADGFWTFDGTNPATGFHILYGYLLYLVFSIAPGLDWKILFLLVGSAAAISIGTAAFLVARVVRANFGNAVAPVAIAPFLGTAALVQSTSMMESWLVLLLSALTVWMVARDRDEHSAGVALTAFAIGLLGSLARIDYGMLPGVLFVACLLFRGQLKKATLECSLLVLAGAVAGVAVTLLHTYLVSGQLSQASAQVKLHWSAVTGHALSAPISLLRFIVLPTGKLLPELARSIVFGAVAAAIVYAAILAYRKREPGARNLGFVLFLGCLVTVAAYVMFYRHNSQSLQRWYSANFLVPIAICFAATFRYMLAVYARWPATITCCAYLAIGVASVASVPWPYQLGLMRAGVHLKDSGIEGPVGAWNAGIISYFSEKNIINIDGLTNDGAFPYIRSNSLMSYIKEHDIQYLLDYQVMLTDGTLRRRGGYDESRADQCIVPLRTVDGDAERWNASEVTLFQVRQECL
jgi:hypothetical protein